MNASKHQDNVLRDLLDQDLDVTGTDKNLQDSVPVIRLKFALYELTFDEMRADHSFVKLHTHF